MREHELLEHERRVESALARAASRMHEAVEPRTPVDELMLSEEAEEFERLADEHERGELLLKKFFFRFLDFLYEDGPHPGWVLRRLYVMARRYRPELILHMNGSELGQLFGETRAAQSHRMQMLFDRLSASGVRGFRGAGCKSETSRSTYAAAAAGNQNRRKKKKKRKSS
jgi:hypothetical protein